ncbi:hypothetical protein Hanom_Chr14g01273381 [Helianthus anomalus]
MVVIWVIWAWDMRKRRMRSFRLLGFSLPRKLILTRMLFCYFLKLPILTLLTILLTQLNPSNTKIIPILTQN